MLRWWICLPFVSRYSIERLRAVIVESDRFSMNKVSFVARSVFS